MKKYQVKIEEDVLPGTFTYEELRANGLLNRRDEHIKVKSERESSWSVAYDYNFSSYRVNEDGTVTRESSGSGGNRTGSGRSRSTGSRTRSTGRQYREPRLSLFPESVDFSSSDGIKTVYVNTTGDDWCVTPSAESWLDAYRIGNSIMVRVDENNSSYFRSTDIEVSSGSVEKHVHVHQSGKQSYTPPPTSDDSDGCSGCLWVFIVIAALFCFL